MKTEHFSEDQWKIVKARLQSMPTNMNVSIGGMGPFTKDQLLEQIDEKSPVGELLVKVNFNYLRSFKKEASVLSV